MNTTRTYTLAPEVAQDPSNWKEGDELVIGSVRLPFRRGGYGIRPAYGDGHLDCMISQNVIGLLTLGVAHIERTVTETWYEEAVRKGWLYVEDDEVLRCVCRKRGFVEISVDGAQFKVHCPEWPSYQFLDCAEAIAAFATPYHTETE